MSCGVLPPGLTIADIFLNIANCYWPTVVNGDPMAPFLIATAPKCRGRRYPWIAPLPLIRIL